LGEREETLKRIDELLEKIFTLNHNTVTNMINSIASNDEEKDDLKSSSEAKVQKVYMLDEIQFARLTSAYKELRDLIRVCLSEIENEEQTNDSSPTDISTKGNDIDTSDDEIENLIESLKDKIHFLYQTFGYTSYINSKDDEDSSEIVPSIYKGTLEEDIRKQEHNNMMDSILNQIRIIQIENDYEKRIKDDSLPVSDTGMLLTTMSDIMKYYSAEDYFKRFIAYIDELLSDGEHSEKAGIPENEQASQEEQSEETEEEQNEFSDLDALIKSADDEELKKVVNVAKYLMIEERYKRLFLFSTGALNKQTSYTSWFLEMYKNDSLPELLNLLEQDLIKTVRTPIDRYLQERKTELSNVFGQIKAAGDPDQVKDEEDGWGYGDN
jgi:hypothetical protein